MSVLMRALALVSADDKWSVRLIGKNLNDEAVLGVTQDIVGHVGFINAPRTVTLQGHLQLLVRYGAPLRLRPKCSLRDRFE